MRKAKIIVAIFIILIGLGLVFRNQILDFYSILTTKFLEIRKDITGFLKEEIGKEISLPPPLRSEEDYSEASLTEEGVIEWTNMQREQNGLPPLRENLKLDASAQAKVDDMFKNQYFAHQSPSDEGVGDLAEKFNYKFIAIGENLALGNFKNDEALVQAWMASPGHRANILNSSYQEIGVAVKKGIFEGETTWLAVQHFGLPLSSCPQPDEKLKAEIEQNQSQIQELESSLLTLKNQIQAMKPKRGDIYNQLVAEYNNLVLQYNNLADETKTLINQYNAQVSLFNNCVS